MSKNVQAPSCYDTLETDFTQKFTRRKRDSYVSMT
jgi:hypothetical protein